MSEKVVGDRGRCVDYIKNIGTELDELGINDKAVQEILSLLSQLDNEVQIVCGKGFRYY